MKNLNRIIEKATLPKLSPVTSVNRKFLYSLFATLFLLTGSLSTKAQGNGTGPTDLYVLPDTLGFTGTHLTQFESSACTSCSPLVNNYGDPYNGASDKWIEINVADAGYLFIHGGTSDFDSVFYLYDSNWNLINVGDDDTGSGDNVGHSYLQPFFQYIYADANSKYYLIVDGSTKYNSAPGTSWTTPKGTVGVTYWITH